MPSASLQYGPLLYNLGTDQVLIWWQTDLDDGTAGVDYRYFGGSTTSVAATTTQIPTSSTTIAYVHAARLTGLIADLTYFFELKGYQYTSATKTFQTLPSTGEVKVGVFGNSRSNVAATVPGLHITLDVLNSLGADAYLGTGGYVSDGASYASWRDGWLGLANSHMQTRGFSGCRGEGDGNSGLAYAMLPFMGGDPSTFEVTLGRARVVALNSVDALAADLRPDGPQGRWFTQEAIRRPEWVNALYRILVVHSPSRTTYWEAGVPYGTDGTEQFLSTYLDSLVRQSGADLVLHGRSRSYQRGVTTSSWPGSYHLTHLLNIAGAGAPQHVDRVWNWDPPLHPNIQYDTKDYVIGMLTISPTVLTVEALDLGTISVVDRVQVLPHTLPT